MLAYPLALLYVFEWLGYQEVALPMKRTDAGWYMQFSDHRVYIGVALVMLVAALLVSLAVERSRFGMSLLGDQAERAGGRGRRHRYAALEDARHRAERRDRGAAGGLYAVVLLVVTPQTVFGMLTSAQALVVTLFGGVGTMWGPVIGASILVPLSETLQAQLGNVIPGIQGVVYGLAIIFVILLAPEGVFWRVRDRLAARGAAPGTAHSVEPSAPRTAAAPPPRVAARLARRADPAR